MTFGLLEEEHDPFTAKLSLYPLGPLVLKTSFTLVYPGLLRQNRDIQEGFRFWVRGKKIVVKGPGIVSLVLAARLLFTLSDLCTLDFID